MYQHHNQLKAPENPNEKIWRYMDFTKFMSLLIDKSIFFCRIDKLGDTHEMSLPRLNRIQDEEFYRKNEKEILKHFNGKMTLQIMNSVIPFLRQSVLVNSWHRNEFESAAMWGLFLKTNEGIAIQSTYTKLCNSFHVAKDNINIGIVEYTDYDNDRIENDSIYGYLSNKLKSYEHERELRAVIPEQLDTKLRPLHKVGKYVPVDLEMLIECIYIAPNAPEWFSKLIPKTIKKLGFDFKISNSIINDRNLH
jgi:hypothetical protein